MGTQGEKKTHFLSESEMDIPYKLTKSYSSIALPYTTPGIYFVISLPNSVSQDVTEIVDVEGVFEVVDSPHRKVDVDIPKFKLEYDK